MRPWDGVARSYRDKMVELSVADHWNLDPTHDRRVASVVHLDPKALATEDSAEAEFEKARGNVAVIEYPVPEAAAPALAAFMDGKHASNGSRTTKPSARFVIHVRGTPQEAEKLILSSPLKNIFRVDIPNP